ncbi:CBS domain containing-hemolysin-like protein [Rhodopirellula rubra]|uniref:CBS domain containing-hemolysin-like protein n=1 Tax=Aporhodopirellula rubra TaxID=980271 RepID=A0A7W5DXY2_9BACT|nr:CNNM domain-containing protein [Aporhodopirellula rubra]MBB3206576.1 CBS domain containing-hemolysin-like protein [Aporhodopirellula rubra]
MSELAAQWPFLLAMFVLIGASGLFSGSEAALFSIRDRERKKLQRSGAAGRVVNHLLDMPDQLLAAILFWNLLINMIYFALVAMVSADMSRPGVFTFAALVTIIFFSEMLPKSVAVMTPVQIALVVGVPIKAAVTMVGPVLPVVQWANEAAARLLWPSFQSEPAIDLADIERAIDLGTDDALLIRRERAALQALVSMAETRADEMMRPRSRLLVATPPLDQSLLHAGSPPGGYMMVADPRDETGETWVGSVAVRLLRPQQFSDLAAAVDPVLFVPWTARVSRVYDELERQDLSVAVVVNEFGEVIGALSIDDILRGVLANKGQRDAAEDQIKRVGGDHYRMAGMTSLRALARTLSIDVPEERAATVSGYVQRHNERVPRVGDVASLPPYELVVTDEDEDDIWIEAWRGPETSGEST